MPSKNFLLLYDLTVRDKHLIETVASRLISLGFSVEVEKLKNEKTACRESNFDVVVINKPHFYNPYRLRQKIRGVKYVVLDTEGVLPGKNSQHSLIEPEGYIHWFSHQADRYKFKNTKTLIAGYPRAYQIKKTGIGKGNQITVATNFSVIGYSDKEINILSQHRKLKLKNDWRLEDYRQFQLKCLKILKALILNNPNFNFVLKFHPNDPSEIQDSFESMEASNVQIFDHKKSINDLFAIKPKYHICFDGCTTILDAYCAGIDSLTISRFPPFDSSKMKGLEFHNLQSGDISIIDINTPQSNTRELDKKFLEEIYADSIGKITDFLCDVFTMSPKIKFYDLPTKRHFRHWLLSMMFWRISTGAKRRKVSTN